MYDIDDLKNLVDMAAGGRSPADLLVTNAKLVDVLTGEIRETDVSVGGGKILGFSHTEAVKVVDARGAYLLPGLIDAHAACELPLRLDWPRRPRSKVDHALAASVPSIWSSILSSGPSWR